MPALNEKRKVVRWKADFEKTCILGCFDRRGWEKCPEDSNDWNIYWANVGSVKYLFSPDSDYRLRDDQILNHFSNHFELTRKDLMVKNIKRYRKDLDKSCTSFLPPTYILPTDYSIFLEEFRRTPQSLWIMKPIGKARGIGIFLVNKLSQIKKWASKGSNQEVYVISRYIERPLLIGGKKFDLRLYVLVTSYRPLKAYLYKDGFARFCNEKYSSDASDRDNHFIHLTNVAIQKHGDQYNAEHGNKWSLSNLRLYLNSAFGSESTQQLFQLIESAIYHSLKSVQGVMLNDKHCFECYGYDMLIDENLKPWLLEVNASPALTATTKSDRSLKHSLLHNVFNIVVPSSLPDDPEERQRCMQEIIARSNFLVICDEEFERDQRGPPAAREISKWR